MPKTSASDARVASGVAAAVDRFMRCITHWRTERQRVHELRSLDPHDLRDLAIDRSEIASIAAEASGKAMPTRRRLFGAGARS